MSMKECATNQLELIRLQCLDLRLYQAPPPIEVNLFKITNITLERLKLLKILDDPALESSTSVSERYSYLEKKLGDCEVNYYLELVGKCNDNVAEARLKEVCEVDHVSHHMLSLAFCKTNELWDWFAQREWDWFLYKFHVIGNENVKEVLKINNFKLDTVNDEEKNRLCEKLIASNPHQKEENVMEDIIYKVPFTQVPFLISNRSCYVEKGYAYILSEDIEYFMKNSFFRLMSRKFINLSTMEIDDDRINDLLKVLDVKNVNKIINVGKPLSGHFDIEDMNLDSYSKMHYPICMRVLHDLLKDKHHLRYFARMQYGLFLKEIGVPYESALIFWKNEFTKKISESEFKKEYEYLIKHQYGKVGSMVKYKTYSCNDIINNRVSGLDQHGCPFAHWDEDHLRTKLLDFNVPSVDIQIIFDLVSKKKYKEACAKYFEVTHKKSVFASSSHPNQYFLESVKLKDDNQKTDFFLPDIEDLFCE